MAQNNQNAPIVIIPWRRPETMDKQEENVRAIERVVQQLADAGGGVWVLTNSGGTLGIDPAQAPSLSRIVIAPIIDGFSNIIIDTHAGGTTERIVLTTVGNNQLSASQDTTITTGRNFLLQATNLCAHQSDKAIYLAPVSAASIPCYISTPPSAPATAPDNGAISFYLDEAGNNLKVEATYSGGTIKTGTIPLV